MMLSARAQLLRGGIHTIPSFGLEGIGRIRKKEYLIGLQKYAALGRVVHSGINRIYSVLHPENAKHNLPIHEMHIGINPSKKK